MKGKRGRVPGLMLGEALCAVVLALCLLTPTSSAGCSTVLKLKVWRCSTSTWTSGAAVSVSVVRPGYGQVGSANKTTDGSGYVDFSFSGLEADDEAHVTVTPSGSGSDSDHVYALTQAERAGVCWDMSDTADSGGCSDDWYDIDERIIKCAYELADPYE